MPLLSRGFGVAAEDTPEVHSPDRLSPRQTDHDSDADDVVKRRSSSTPSSPRSKHKITPRSTLLGSLGRRLSPRADSLK